MAAPFPPFDQQFLAKAVCFRVARFPGYLQRSKSLLMVSPFGSEPLVRALTYFWPGRDGRDAVQSE